MNALIFILIQQTCKIKKIDWSKSLERKKCTELTFLPPSFFFGDNYYVTREAINFRMTIQLLLYLNVTALNRNLSMNRAHSISPFSSCSFWIFIHLIEFSLDVKWKKILHTHRIRGNAQLFWDGDNFFCCYLQNGGVDCTESIMICIQTRCTKKKFLYSFFHSDFEQSINQMINSV